MIGRAKMILCQDISEIKTGRLGKRDKSVNGGDKQ